MLKKYARLVLIPANLKLFDGEGGGSAPSGGEGVGTGDSVSPVTPTGNKGDKPVVLYGKQPEGTETQREETGQAAVGEKEIMKTPEQLRAEYEAFKKSEYKQFIDADIQNVINKRFRESKVLEAQIADINPIIEVLSEKYGTTDVKELASKIRQDSLEDLAYAAGMSIEEYEKVMTLRRENRMLKQRQETWEAEQRMNQQIQAWNEQANQLKTIYPDFDLQVEVQNSQFLDLLKAGVAVEAAYKLIHMDDIVSGTAKQAQQNMAANIQAKGNRPKESAAKGTPGIVVKSDPSKLSKADREEIARRVMMGENISF